jgi:hypothetical protein
MRRLPVLAQDRVASPRLVQQAALERARPSRRRSWVFSEAGTAAVGKVEAGRGGRC